MSLYLGTTPISRRVGLSPIDIIFSGEVDSQGNYIPAYECEYIGDVVFTGIKHITDPISKPSSTYAAGCFASYFNHEFTSQTTGRLKCRLIRGKISFPDLETINVTSTSTSTYSVLGTTFNSFCNGQSAITEFLFPKLSSITSSSLRPFAYAFQNTTITSIRFPALSYLSGDSIFQYAFSKTYSLKDIYFDALTTTSFGTTKVFNGMMSGATNSSSVVHTIHFPSNMESTISGLSGYPLFSGASGYVTLAYDLPATS